MPTVYTVLLGGRLMLLYPDTVLGVYWEPNLDHWAERSYPLLLIPPPTTRWLHRRCLVTLHPMGYLLNNPPPSPEYSTTNSALDPAAGAKGQAPDRKEHHQASCQCKDFRDTVAGCRSSPPKCLLWPRSVPWFLSE